MVEIGSTIEAEVTRIEPFGMYLRHGDEEVIVLLPEFSWQPTKDPKEAVRIGERLKVYVLRYNYSTKQIVGSVRRLHPEQNPYRELARLPAGEVLSGSIAFNAGEEITIKFPNGAWGHLPRRQLIQELHTGDEVAVEIDALDVDEGNLGLKAARSTPRNGETLSKESPFETSRSGRP